MFKRKIYDKLLAWKQESAGKTELGNLLLWKNLRKMNMTVIF